MRILFTNFTLAWRAGTELWVRDVALRLHRLGHVVGAFTPLPGEVAAEMRAAGITVVDDPAALPFVPEIVHAHHHRPTAIALLAFPCTPAVAACHGAQPPEEAVVSFPGIRRYVAVDRATRARLLAAGIDADRIVTVPNFVDLERFAPRPRLPARPSRALVLSNQASDATQLPAIREACRALGIDVEVAGLASGRPTRRPEVLLRAADVVFAKGRAALEAAAVGAAVVLCDADGLGPMVTAAELAELRADNLGLRRLTAPITADEVRRRLAAYDPVDAALVRDRVRREAGLDAAVEWLLDLWYSVLAEADHSPPPDVAEVGAAASRYLLHGPLDDATPGHWRPTALEAQQAAEIAHMRDTAAWRLRERIVGSAVLRSTYRALRRAVRWR